MPRQGQGGRARGTAARARPPGVLATGASNTSTKPAESLVCITSIVTASGSLRAAAPGAIVSGAGASWAGINTCTKTFALPSQLPCAWANLPQANAIKAIPSGSTLQLVGRDLRRETVEPYVLEAIRAGAAVRLCFVAKGVGEAEQRHELVHIPALFTVADVLALGNDPSRIGEGPAKACNKCGRKDRLMRCTQCKCAWYCSKSEQREHWATHKPQCIPSMRAIKASDAMVGTFCPLTQYHAEDVVPISLTAPPTAGVKASTDTFQHKIRGVHSQIREFLERQRQRVAEKEQAARARASENGTFIPLLQFGDFEEFLAKDEPAAVDARPEQHQSICCGSKPHDWSKIMPNLPPREHHTEPMLPPLRTYVDAFVTRKRKCNGAVDAAVANDAVQMGSRPQTEAPHPHALSRTSTPRSNGKKARVDTNVTD